MSSLFDLTGKNAIITGSSRGIGKAIAHRMAQHGAKVVIDEMSLEILEQAVAQSGLNRDKLRKTISSKTFQTVNGPVRFEGVMNVLLPAMMSQIQDGKTHIIWPPKQATAKIIPKPAWK